MRALLAALPLALAACAAAPTPPVPLDTGLVVRATGAPGQAAAVRVDRVDARVKAVDLAARTVTVEGPGGETETFKVGPEVKRLGEVFAGDTIAIEAEQGLMLEHQPAGEATVAPEGGVAGARAPPNEAPGFAVASTVRATVTVAAIDPAGRTLVFQGPAGHRYRVGVGPKVKLEALRVGDRLLATYVKAVAVRVTKGGTEL